MAQRHAVDVQSTPPTLIADDLTHTTFGNNERGPQQAPAAQQTAPFAYQGFYRQYTRSFEVSQLAETQTLLDSVLDVQEQAAEVCHTYALSILAHVKLSKLEAKTAEAEEDLLELEIYNPDPSLNAFFKECYSFVVQLVDCSESDAFIKVCDKAARRPSLLTDFLARRSCTVRQAFL